MLQRLVVGTNGAAAMGAETDSGRLTESAFYDCSFAYTSGGRTFMFALDNSSRNWIIREILADGSLGSAPLRSGTFLATYPTMVHYAVVGGRNFLYGQNTDPAAVYLPKSYIICELLPNGAMGLQTATGTWQRSYPVTFPFQVNTKQYLFQLCPDDNHYSICNLPATGKMGEDTDSGDWKTFYEVCFAYTIGDRTFLYGQKMSTRAWFTQELKSGGKLASSESDRGVWNYSYNVSVPFQIGTKTYFYAQSNANLAQVPWSVYELLPTGKMNLTVQASGVWTDSYPFSTFIFQ